jgi:uncharacterized membrane protein YfhO
VAYIETDLSLTGTAQGAAEIVAETPVSITLRLNMKTPGLVVLADLWDKGWRAAVDGAPVSIVRVNHALRGVPAPEGAQLLRFDYQPASFTLGLWLAGLAMLSLVCWVGSAARKRQ